MEHHNSIEKIGKGLISSLETFKGATISLVQRLSGFNGLSIYKEGGDRGRVLLKCYNSRLILLNYLKK